MVLYNLMNNTKYIRDPKLDAELREWSSPSVSPLMRSAHWVSAFLLFPCCAGCKNVS